MHTFKADRGPIRGLLFSPSGRELLVSGDELLTTWAVPSGEQLDSVEVEWCRSMAFSPDGRWFATGGRRQLTLLDAETRDVVLEWDCHATRITFSHDGRHVISFGLDRVRAWDVTNGTERPDFGSVDFEDVGWHQTNGLAAHPEADLVVASLGREHDGSRETALLFLEPDQPGRIEPLPLRSHFITSLVYTLDGRHLVGLSGNVLRAWDAESLEEVLAAKTRRKHWKDVVVTADGERVVAVANDGSIRVWSTRDWTEMADYEWDVGPLTNLAASPDATLLAAGGKRGRVVLWDDLES